MKYIFLIFSCFIALEAIAQSPEKIKFQAIAQDLNGEPITTPIEVRISITEGMSGPAYYVDEQTVAPNDQGLFTLNIGDGPITNTMASVRWSRGPVYFKVEIKTSIGGDWEELGDPQEMLSVPYALYGEDADADQRNELQTIELSDDGVLSLSNQGGEVKLPIAKTEIISINALGLNFNRNSTLSISGSSLNWANNFSSSANICMRKPANYKEGGEVTFKLFFRTNNSSSGNVQFFIRPRSFNGGDGLIDAPSISADVQRVTGTIGFGTFYEQSITIPGDRLRNDWWFITIQRNSSVNNAHTGDLSVYSVALEFDQF